MTPMLAARLHWYIAWLILLALACSVAGCDRNPAPKGLVRSAEFGVFFGGQIQERRDIPFEVDPSKQTHGFRIQFYESLKHAVELNWELDMPGSSKRVRDLKGRPGRGRLVELGETKIEAGQSKFDKVMQFRPGDPLGLWNIRVVMGDRVLIDRPFFVYNPYQRARAQQSDGGM